MAEMLSWPQCVETQRWQLSVYRVTDNTWVQVSELSPCETNPETKRLSGWLPWSALGTLKLANDVQGCQPDDFLFPWRKGQMNTLSAHLNSISTPLITFQHLCWMVLKVRELLFQCIQNIVILALFFECGLMSFCRQVSHRKRTIWTVYVEQCFVLLRYMTRYWAIRYANFQETGFHSCQISAVVRQFLYFSEWIAVDVWKLRNWHTSCKQLYIL